MKRKQIYLVKANSGYAQLCTTKREAIAVARQLHAEVRAIPLVLFNAGARPYGWDVPTFRVQSDLVADFSGVRV